MFRSVYYAIYKKFLKNVKKKNIFYKPLIIGLLKKNGGRNNLGKITCYHRGGGVKRLYRKINNNYYNLFNMNLKKWIVERIEYDPNRTSYIALLKSNYMYQLNKNNYNLNKFYNYFFNNIYIYRLANENLNKGDLISFFEKENQDFAIKNQYSFLKDIMTGEEIFNIEYKSNTYGKLVRAAGCKAKLLRKYNKNALIILPSKEKKLLSLWCYASIGKVSNSLKLFKKDYKAGNSRLKNIRPKVRGVAMNPVDHPHGGGEGKTSGGRHSVSKWGILTKGYVTKRKKEKKKKKYV